MARYPNAAIQALVYSDGTLTPDDLNKLSATDSSAAELNLLDGLSVAGNATASKVVVVDADKALLGLRRKVTVDGGLTRFDLLIGYGGGLTPAP
jgi:hypothetical protein